MSDKRDPATDQRLPQINDNPAIHDLVEADIASRKRLGISKYGVALQAENGRNMLQDAYEELLDLAIYLKGRLEEDKMRAEKQEQIEEDYAQTHLFRSDVFEGRYCGCIDPRPLAVGHPYLVCGNCMCRVPDAKLAHKQ